MDVKPPAEATLVRPSVLTGADSLAAQHLESEKTTLDMLLDDSKNTQNTEMILGTSDTHGDTPSAGLRVDDRPVWEKTNYDPLDYDYGDPWLDD